MPIFYKPTGQLPDYSHVVAKFALLFRTSRSLSPEELKQRQTAILKWAEGLRQQSIPVDPRRLDKTLGEFIPGEGEATFQPGSADEDLRNLVFFEAENEEVALHVARTHPGLQYGTRIEVRQWSSPAAAA